MVNSFKNDYQMTFRCKPKLIVLILVLFTTSCEDLLHEEEISIGEIQNYDQLLLASGGVYGVLAESFFGGYGRYCFYNANLKGDDLRAFPGGNYASYYNSSCVPQSTFSYSSEIYYLWKSMYQTIASANNILVQYDLSALHDKATKELLGEIYFIRAYCYFKLTRVYGQIPLIDNIDISYNTPKPTFKQIYEFIEHDLKTAMQLLPENNILARKPFVTPNRGSAKAVLAEVYLSWAGYPCRDRTKYELATKEAGETIDSAQYFGIALLDDFSWLWDKEHFFNAESVFSIFTTSPENSTLLETWANIYCGWYNNSASFNYTLYLNPNLKIETFFYSSEINFFNTYPPGYRKEITFYTNIYVPIIYPIDPEIDTGYFHITTISSCDRVAYRKFYYDAVMKDIDQYYGDNNFLTRNFYIGTTRAYLFRYAHTLLTYAEASARAGVPNQKSYECINMIRRRAHNVDIYSPSVYDLQSGLSPEVFADSVVWERAWELAGEPEGRWFDLVRLEMVEDLPNLRHPQEGSPPESFDKSAYFFPPLAEDTKLNPNLGIR